MENPQNQKGYSMKSKYEVWVTCWSDEYHCRVKRLAGSFERFLDAKLFAKAYSEFFSSDPEIVEYVRK